MLTTDQLVGLAECTACQKVHGSLESLALSTSQMDMRDVQMFSESIDASPTRLTQAQRDRNAWVLAKQDLRGRALDRLAARRAREYARTGVE